MAPKNAIGLDIGSSSIKLISLKEDRKGVQLQAFDMADLMKRDPHTRDIMKDFEGRYEVGDSARHSHVSWGPRYEAGEPWE